MLHNGNEAIGTDSRVNLYSDSVLSSAPEFLDFKVLLEPLEEQLYLPTILVEVGNLQCGHFCGIGQEHEFMALRVNYVGDVAMAFMKGQLVQDEFYHGEPWTIGLKRYYNDLKTDPLTFYFRPLQKNAPFLRDLPKQAVPDFSDGAVVEIRDVEVVPEYRLRVTF